MFYKDVLSGFFSSTFISPFMAVIHISIIKSQIDKNNLKQSYKNVINEYNGKKFMKPYCIMNMVYSSTYITANITQTYCKKNNIDYNIPTLFFTSIVNMFMIAYKDKEYSKLLIKKNITGSNPVIKINFPIKSYLLFGMRDITTIFSSFVMKQDLVHKLEKYTSHNVADLSASFLLPISAQLISTPLHILAIDFYNNPNNNLNNRLQNIKKLYKNVCFGRMIRVIPAFGVGGFLNDYLNNY